MITNKAIIGAGILVNFNNEKVEIITEKNKSESTLGALISGTIASFNK